LSSSSSPLLIPPPPFQLFNLPIKQVVKPADDKTTTTTTTTAPLEEAFVDEGVSINSGSGFDGLSTSECKKVVMDTLEEKGKGGKQTTFRLRDWVFSR